MLRDPYQTQMYLSGSFVDHSITEEALRLNAYRLCSFAYPTHAHEFLEYAHDRGISTNIMIDSGAFTSWSLGKPVTLGALLAYNKALLAKWPNHNYTFIALDVIPGDRTRIATESEVKVAVEHSYFNYRAMQQELPGHTIMPVYHSGEERAVRNRYLQDNDYICLSMNQRMSAAERTRWAQEAYVDGYRFHGLAATGNKMLREIDWYSVDSATWLMLAIYGRIFVPLNNEYAIVGCSDRTSNIKEWGHHILNMAELPQLERYINDCGFNLQALNSDYTMRMRWNMNQWYRFPLKKRLTAPLRLFD